MGGSANDRSLPDFFRLLGKPINYEILKALASRKLTLPGLAKKVGRSKSHVCTYLSELHDSGLIDKSMEGGRKRYRVRVRGVKGFFDKGRKLLHEARAAWDEEETESG
ncbi:MAG: HVO_A0114 family putative DNA-binding protein [Planctomycetota bacterium]|jgi:predicted transcriptional regulator